MPTLHNVDVLGTHFAVLFSVRAGASGGRITAPRIAWTRRMPPQQKLLTLRGVFTGFPSIEGLSGHKQRFHRTQAESHFKRLV